MFGARGGGGGEEDNERFRNAFSVTKVGIFAVNNSASGIFLFYNLFLCAMVL